MTTEKTEKTAVYIGRFQPFHKAHLGIILQALRTTEIDKLIILVGSANQCRSAKNPFTFTERKNMIMQSVNGLEQAFKEDKNLKSLKLSDKIDILPLDDYMYTQEKWYASVRHLTKGASYIVGHDKDASSQYLTEFPELEFMAFDGANSTIDGVWQTIHATRLRQSLFSEYHGSLLDVVPSILLEETPEGMHEFLKWFINQETFTNLKEEYDYFRAETERFKGYPFPDSLNCCTADAVVVCRGHVLLVTRANAPGKGLLALPGGHKDHETFLQCALRELMEETCLKVPEKVMRGSLKAEKMFDDPKRSQNLVKPSMAYYFNIEPNYDGSLPQVKPASDALAAGWYELGEVSEMPTRLFDDHSEMIGYFTGV